MHIICVIDRNQFAKHFFNFTYIGYVTGDYFYSCVKWQSDFFHEALQHVTFHMQCFFLSFDLSHARRAEQTPNETRAKPTRGHMECTLRMRPACLQTCHRSAQEGGWAKLAPQFWLRMKGIVSERCNKGESCKGMETRRRMKILLDGSWQKPWSRLRTWLHASRPRPLWPCLAFPCLSCHEVGGWASR